MRASFYLYFEEEAPAREAGAVLERRGFDVEVRAPDEQILQWAVLASQDTSGRVVSLGFRVTEWRLERLARRLGGEYDGHEVEVAR